MFLAAFRSSKTWALVGLGLLVASCFLRAIALWDLNQEGVGSNFIATSVWLWIALLSFFLFLVVLKRGILTGDPEDE